MIINKTTSDELLVDSLVAIDSNGKPIKNVTEFNTDTRLATLGGGGTEAATSFIFSTAPENVESLMALLDEDLKPLVSVNKKFTAKKAMDDVAAPDNYLIINTFPAPLRPYAATCTNCSTKFLIYVDENNNLWTAIRSNPVDNFETLTQIDDSSLTCDNCSQAVAVYDENPW